MSDLVGEAWQTGHVGDLVTCEVCMLMGAEHGSSVQALIYVRILAVCSPAFSFWWGHRCLRCPPWLQELLNSSPWDGLLSLVLGVMGPVFRKEMKAGGA